MNSKRNGTNKCVPYVVMAILFLVIIGCPDSRVKVTPLNNLSLDKTTLTLLPGEQQILTPIFSPENATNKDVVWSSSDESIAVVSDEGVVAAISIGSATISVSSMELSAMPPFVRGDQGGIGKGGYGGINQFKSDDDLSATCEVTVIEYTFTVANAEQWHDAIEIIKSKGDDKSYLINITDDFAIPGIGENEFTFDNIKGLKVSINGKHTISRLYGRFLFVINSFQDMSITDLTLNAPGNYSNHENAIVYVNGYEAIFTMKGSATIYDSPDLGILVRNFGTLNMENQAKIELAYIGVNARNEGTFNLYDQATISLSNTGAVVSDRSIFNMYGGRIYDNTNIQRQGKSAGVRLNNSSIFNMFGGEISNNTNFGLGGGSGVFIYDYGSFNMSGGIISENTASFKGGGVSIEENSNFYMSGGTIEKNTSGGVYVYSGGNFFMSGGIITDNFSKGNGGGVSIGDSGGFDMSAGIIQKNTANGYGGGLFIDRYGRFYMSGGTIYGSFESGENIELANESGLSGASLFRYNYIFVSIAKYGDETDILPHTDGSDEYTNYTIIGRK